MEKEIAKLRQQLQEEHRRRELAESAAESSRRQALQDYLQACHSLSLAIQVVTDRSMTTQGDTTKPAGRLFPQRTIPWDSSATQQEEIWNQVSISSDFHSRGVFPSAHQLEYERSLIAPISGEIELRNYERDTVENTVQKLVNAVYDDELLRNQLGLRGTVTFGSHTNLGQTNNSSINESMEQMSISEDNSDDADTVAQKRRKGKISAHDRHHMQSRSPKGPLAIEYKAPHKLSRDEIVTGLDSEIQPERDVINKEGDNFAFTSKSLVAAVITQLFSYMIGKGIQYGYVCTGEVFIFLHISDDPTVVYYSVSVPNIDFQEDDENRFHRSAVAQVFAFIIRALLKEPPPQSWHEKTLTLDIWEVEYINVLKNIPRQFANITLLPLINLNIGGALNARRFERALACSAASAGNTEGNSKSKRGQCKEGGQKTQRPLQSIDDRSFCTQQCLLGLAYGGAMDSECPNSDDHGMEHISRTDFLHLVRSQLAQDRGPEADCRPLYLSGSRGALFKVRLSSHGYTLVAKDVERCDRSLLQRENKLYNRLRTIQGGHIPVCLGLTDLDIPYYYDSGIYVSILLLGWAGQPLLECIDQDNKERLQNKVAIAFTALHRLHVLHHDAELRNIVYELKDRLMIVDFERAEFRGR
ncbi:hypothetical protein PAAG_04350 [Paracoccidioides lutzii Pb01]|uniref:Protein kinase domain-containing protein n=1 Tax=Paracoccidioides lutzii (strain ATCC MYA-826 / Pb01) TaxID=502779 RepID=C1H0Q6_PARBA|nr:hypothetical protein PAAG_04350 [Paracoccidioides lutzii Pb01]EEH33300.2 hypothetical protein PAAG_04350 [Paracoccidioides lutzii Pb01]